MSVSRLNSGIEGLDNLIEGGFPEGSNILITGGPGTGKSILGLQFIVHGARNGESGVYLTVEENKDKIISQAQQFGWDIEKLEKEKRVIVNTIEESTIGEILDNLDKEVKELKPRRIVIDSLSMMSIFVRTVDLPHNTVRELSRYEIVGILKKLSGLGTTNLIICEDHDMSDNISEFACDGVIELRKDEIIGKRKLIVEKMRSTNIDLIPKDFYFTPNGIKVVNESKH